MRYLGNKTRLLPFINKVMEKYSIQGKTFVDLFTGTGSVADQMKNRFTVIANDYMKFSAVIAEAKITNTKVPNFTKFRSQYGCSPLEWLNEQKYESTDAFFVYHTYSPAGDRMYFTEENAIRIDGMRIDIERLYKDGLLRSNEYSFLLASLLESILGVSNTSGTYQAFFKFWESRATKDLILKPLSLNVSDTVDSANHVYCEDANTLVRHISGDIVYLDPPYTVTQYANMYHVLETIARYDSPEVFGRTGRRKSRVLSGYSNRHKAIVEFEDLFRQLDFQHILISYSNQSIIPLSDLVELASRFAVDGKVYVEKSEYREYSSNNPSYKGSDEKLKETVLYFQKDRLTHKSPLNYSGSKDLILPKLTRCMPKHVGTFVDAMGGGFNVGANVVATEQVIYNEYNARIFEIVKMLVEKDPEEIIRGVKRNITQFGLRKKAKEQYLNFRAFYNTREGRTPLNLFTLQIYAFQNMIRFNSSGNMNTPVGNNEFNDGTIKRIREFNPKTQNVKLLLGKYQDLLVKDFPEDALFYFDPPYFLSTAEYNDGKRGLDGWNTKSEIELLDSLLSLDQKGYRFMLSNVLEHRGRKHHILYEWVKEHNFYTHIIGKTGIKYPRIEVLITNYKE